MSSLRFFGFGKNGNEGLGLEIPKHMRVVERTGAVFTLSDSPLLERRPRTVGAQKANMVSHGVKQLGDRSDGSMKGEFDVAR